MFGTRHLSTPPSRILPRHQIGNREGVTFEMMVGRSLGRGARIVFVVLVSANAIAIGASFLAIVGEHMNLVFANLLL